MDLQTLRSEKKIGILGYGINNKELVRFLASEGIACTVRDTRPELEKEFRSQFAELNDLVSWEVPKEILADLEVFSLVFRSPSIPFLSPALQKAAKKGVKIYSQTKLFFDLCPAPIIAVTGTKGKGTTSSLIHRVLEAGYKDGKTYLAGNIGLDPFSFYSKLTPEDVVILELSSFQIQDLHKGPYMAVLLTIGVDHLDHHASVEEYRQAKQRLALTQTEDDVLIVNVQQPEMMQYAKSARGALYCYSRHTPRRQSAWSLQEDGKEIVFVQVGGEIDSFDITPRKLKGEHNLDNILPAAIIGALYDIPMPVIQEAVCSFPGLEHRLSFVGSYSEVEFYDDSIATTPESCLVAVEAFPGRLHLVVGGNDKGGDYATLTEELVKRCVTISLLPGTATKKLAPLLKKAASKHGSKVLILDQATEPWMPTILSGLHPHLQPGDTVLLSPAGSSFSSFKDAKARGDAFVKAVRERYS